MTKKTRKLDASGKIPVCNDLSEQPGKATPRPWTISSKSGFEIIASGALHIADCHTPYTHPLNTAMTYEQAIANAALIVEAVNAYEHAALQNAVKKLAPLIGAIESSGQDEDGNLSSYDAGLVEDAKAALAALTKGKS
jgi:hypothetical protein